MKLQQAVRKLGGTTEAAKIAGLSRTTLDYWLRTKKWPKWRQPDIDRIMEEAGKTNGSKGA